MSIKTKCFIFNPYQTGIEKFLDIQIVSTQQLVFKNYISQQYQIQDQIFANRNYINHLKIEKSEQIQQNQQKFSELSQIKEENLSYSAQNNNNVFNNNEIQIDINENLAQNIKSFGIDNQPNSYKFNDILDQTIQKTESKTIEQQNQNQSGNKEQFLNLNKEPTIFNSFKSVSVQKNNSEKKKFKNNIFEKNKEQNISEQVNQNKQRKEVRQISFFNKNIIQSIQYNPTPQHSNKYNQFYNNNINNNQNNNININDQNNSNNQNNNFEINTVQSKGSPRKSKKMEEIQKIKESIQVNQQLARFVLFKKSLFFLQIFFNLGAFFWFLGLVQFTVVGEQTIFYFLILGFFFQINAVKKFYQIELQKALAKKRVNFLNKNQGQQDHMSFYSNKNLKNKNKKNNKNSILEMQQVKFQLSGRTNSNSLDLTYDKVNLCVKYGVNFLILAYKGIFRHFFPITGIWHLNQWFFEMDQLWATHYQRRNNYQVPLFYFLQLILVILIQLSLFGGAGFLQGRFLKKNQEFFEYLEYDGVILTVAQVFSDIFLVVVLFQLMGQLYNLFVWKKKIKLLQKLKIEAKNINILIISASKKSQLKSRSFGSTLQKSLKIWQQQLEDEEEKENQEFEDGINENQHKTQKKEELFSDSEDDFYPDFEDDLESDQKIFSENNSNNFTSSDQNQHNKSIENQIKQDKINTINSIPTTQRKITINQIYEDSKNSRQKKGVKTPQNNLKNSQNIQSQNKIKYNKININMNFNVNVNMNDLRNSLQESGMYISDQITNSLKNKGTLNYLNQDSFSQRSLLNNQSTFNKFQGNCQENTNNANYQNDGTMSTFLTGAQINQVQSNQNNYNNQQNIDSIQQLNEKIKEFSLQNIGQTNSVNQSQIQRFTNLKQINENNTEELQSPIEVIENYSQNIDDNENYQQLQHINKVLKQHEFSYKQKHYQGCQNQINDEKQINIELGKNYIQHNLQRSRTTSEDKCDSQQLKKSQSLKDIRHYKLWENALFYKTQEIKEENEEEENYQISNEDILHIKNHLQNSNKSEGNQQQQSQNQEKINKLIADDGQIAESQMAENQQNKGLIAKVFLHKNDLKLKNIPYNFKKHSISQPSFIISSQSQSTRTYLQANNTNNNSPFQAAIQQNHQFNANSNQNQTDTLFTYNLNNNTNNQNVNYQSIQTNIRKSYNQIDEFQEENERSKNKSISNTNNQDETETNFDNIQANLDQLNKLQEKLKKKEEKKMKKQIQKKYMLRRQSQLSNYSYNSDFSNSSHSNYKMQQQLQKQKAGTGTTSNSSFSNNVINKSKQSSYQKQIPSQSKMQYQSQNYPYQVKNFQKQSKYKKQIYNNDISQLPEQYDQYFQTNKNQYNVPSHFGQYDQNYGRKINNVKKRSLSENQILHENQQFKKKQPKILSELDQLQPNIIHQIYQN
ncbi:hypothetical protein PPERSA_11636 [Pseudocohnilembus persalinus]|uniref:Transmembrane protein n=1 Tax=Pseudocohnilembus persalinus TaxID=266149 RepID=A0A0V0QA44_PSEPJ|nr:hypothetical protein PPERSA_11636 [Pseudocohnilembus persalinus]|eukprot:KRW99035.1 hypothetical protein PPERSA_11636 [Pseudocohnilembus persalinus]